MPTSKWTRFLIVVVAVLTISMIAALIIGSRLPAEQSAHAVVELALSPEEVWEHLADVKEHPRSALSAVSVEVIEPTEGRQNWREHLGQSTQTWTSSTWNPPTEMVNDGTDSEIALTSSWHFLLEPTANGTKLDMIVTTVVPSGGWQAPFFRVILNLGGTRVGASSYLRNTFPGVSAKTISWVEKSQS